MSALDRTMLTIAARAGLRGFGAVEPNPMVGCVIGQDDGTVLSIGHHRIFGGSHAEIDALGRCRELGFDPRGATCWVTLEPCSVEGKTPPCTEALIAAGIRRVVYAATDTTLPAPGGAVKLQAAGIDARHSTASKFASSLAIPFLHSARTHRPWVRVKWAHTIDGRIATSRGESQWISNQHSRRAVHRQRGCCDAILTGIGTVLADDPLLTARTNHPRRTPRRVIIDPRLETPLDGQLMASIPNALLTIVTATPSTRSDLYEAKGAQVLHCASDIGTIDLRQVLSDLWSHHAISTVFVEAGPRLIGHLMTHTLVDELIVYTAPMVFGDGEAPCAVAGPPLAALDAAHRFTLWHVRQRAGDIEARYIRSQALR